VLKATYAAQAGHTDVNSVLLDPTWFPVPSIDVSQGAGLCS
jgi:hypothetical protein